MGDGSVRVTSIQKHPVDGTVGVAFSAVPENKVVGKYIDEDKNGKPVTGLGVHTQLLFDNPASIDVVIGQLEEAKQYLIKPSA
ncbi:MAG: hypothetical protein CMB80_08790 [Flammeovirgaceae bacterium]|nr:hypothetical protein [Flammeovirgaceae bacterium]